MSESDPNIAEPASDAKKRVWLRGFFMLAFVIFFALAETLLHLMAVVQFLWLLFSGARNEAIARFGGSLSVWLADVARFQSCETEEKPFPWKDWPAAAR